jgi:crotonobetaine/carnitine-CoA ligase
MNAPDDSVVHPFVGYDLPHLLDLQARSRGAHPFLRWSPFEGDGYVLTYADFADGVARVAGSLKVRGVQTGDRVLIHLENCPESAIAWFACAWLGATAVMTNARSAPDELAYFAAHSGAIAAITQPKLYGRLAASCSDLRWIAVTDTDNGAAPGPDDLPRGHISFSDLLAGGEREPLRPAEPLLPLGIQYTSGTTSRPKGVVMTHANALWGGKVGAAHAGLTPDDIFLIHLPLYHVIALSYGLLSTLWAGGTVVLQPRFSASRFWPISVAEKCTWSAMVPFCVRALAEQDVPANHSFRAWGNAFWSAELENRYKLSILGWWGMTEIITHGIVGDVGRPGRPTAIGRPAPEYDLAIRRDDGSPVNVGETGHLFIRGRRGISIFAGYLDDPAATAESFDESGFFKTGDLVTLHCEGFIQFADRAKDMLKVGGENVATSEIERVIQSIAGVREAAVVGRKHHMLQEVPVAYVVTTSAEIDALREQILDLCRVRLSEFKVPRRVHFVADLPRGLTEKVSKLELRRRANEED